MNRPTSLLAVVLLPIVFWVPHPAAGQDDSDLIAHGKRDETTSVADAAGNALGTRHLDRLPYNHPGLVVDLGVGLWAWPLPMDYDGDGDLDLVVSCADKPFDATVLFENPGGDTRMPVFKPAVRLGPPKGNCQVAYVDGRPRVTSPGYEYPDFLASAFARPRKLPADTRVHHGGKVRANQWKYTDYDGDGRLDLTVGIGDWIDYGWDNAFDPRGRWTNGPLHGFVYLLRNTASDDTPHYAAAVKLAAGGRPIDVYGMPSPNLADFDGDGDLDLVCGEFLDKLTWFENTGSRTRPQYAAGRYLLSGGRPLAMDLCMIVPVAVDWDRDGDPDLVVGQEDGRVALIENTGKLADRMPVFAPPRFFQQQADGVKFGALVTPVGFDLDGDGDEDLVCGNTAGYVGWIENLDGGNPPKWAAPRYLRADGRVIRIQAGPNGSIQGPCEAKWGYTTLSVADWDQDGLPDLVVNSIWGKVVWYRNVGTRKSPRFSAARPIRVAWPGPPPKPAWNWWNPQPGELATQWRTTPVAVDFDGDGLCDLVMLDQEGYLALYRRRRVGGKLELGPPERVFHGAGPSAFDHRQRAVDRRSGLLRLNRGQAGQSGRRKLCVVDWDGDGKLDLLVNSINVNFLKNVSTDRQRYVFEDTGPLDSRVLAGHTTSPTVVDWDGNGVPDLLVGAEDGHLYYLKNPRAEARAAGDPPAEQAGMVTTEFIYERAPFASCHASTIAATPTGLVAAWFGGTEEGDPDVGIWMSRREGRRWSAPVEVANGVSPHGKRYPCWNPVLFQAPGGPLLLFYKVGPSPRTWWGMLTRSKDHGRTWSEPARLPDRMAGPIKNKPVLLDDGTLLCGSSTEDHGWRVHMEWTTDLGTTWDRTKPLGDGVKIGAIQPTILRHAGRLQFLCRTRQGRIGQSWSEDGGRSWSPLTLGELPNPNSGIDAVTLADGRQLLVYNHTRRGRSPLNVALSRDGRSWQAALVLENEPGEYSYPAVIQTADGLVHATYTWRRKKIKHVVIDPSKLVLRPMAGGKWPE